MRKEIMIYVLCFAVLIASYLMVWREIPSRKMSECPGGVSNAQEMAFKITNIKYRLKNGLCVDCGRVLYSFEKKVCDTCLKGLISLGTQTADSWSEE